MASPHVATSNSSKAKYVHRLDSPHGLRRELAALYTEARRGTIDGKHAYQLALILGQLAKVMEVAELAEQLHTLEAASAHTLRRIA